MKTKLFYLGALAVIASFSLTASLFRLRATARVFPTEGRASWYGEEFRGRKMANGEPFNPQAFTCASYDFPLGTKLWVQNVVNGKIVEVVVSDRGPSRRLNRVLDLSSGAFSEIADLKDGVINIRIVHHYQ